MGLIVHATNPVTELTDEEVRRIFTGEVSNWSEVGGADAEIVVVNKAAGRATLEVFRKYFGLEESEIQPDVVIGDNEQGVKTVAGSPTRGWLRLDRNGGVRRPARRADPTPAVQRGRRHDRQRWRGTLSDQQASQPHHPARCQRAGRASSSTFANPRPSTTS